MHTNRRMRPELSAVAAWIALMLLASRGVWAHPLSQGSLDVVVQQDRVLVRASVTLEEVSVTDMLTSPDTAAGAPQAVDAMNGAYGRHARYLSAHVHLRADGRDLPANVVRITPPSPGSGGGGAPTAGASTRRATYEFAYGPISSPRPASIELRQDVLTDPQQMLPGAKWEATYVVRIGREGGRASEGLLLTSREPIVFPCGWSTAGSAGSGAAMTDLGRTMRQYLRHGIHHILTGYDHLLFISALVLATTRLWDLIRVVTAFTLAHTITLTLAALKLVHLPETVVEPLIAGSIVFVAVQNVFWPERTRGWGRLGAAFFFGLFHGLGFAGGLLEAMQDMGGLTVLIAIAAFSLGVEIGHQMIVLPLFGGLKLARRTRPDVVQKERFSILAQRIGSAAISLAGLFYLVVALRLSFAPGP